jgi:glycosyltransferase involved in cell wall biosynthesis
MQDYISAQRPDIVLASSKEVKQRINKYYRRNSVVIYPPVITPQKVNTSTKKEYYLCVSRLVKQKGIELAIRACNQLHLPLLIIGKGKQEKFLKSISGPTIQFKGFVPDARMDALYEKAIALIYCSLEEDFGIVPVEAMGYGLPVIAYDSGAVKETVIPGKTGILFKEYTLSSITAAIKEFEKNKFDPKICRKQANKFSEMKFIASIKKMTSAKIKYD